MLCVIQFIKKKICSICILGLSRSDGLTEIRVITKLPNFEQSNKVKVKTHKYKYINRQSQSTTGKL